MKDLNKYVAIYKAQLNKGDIAIAYKELVKFMMKLRTDCSKRFSHQYAFSGILHGYLDYTYFYYSNDFLKSKKLKLGLVLNHREIRFEIWLLGNTIPTQKKYWELLKTAKWNRDKTEMPDYSILETTLVITPDFNDLDKLTEQIETKMLRISDEVVKYLRTIN